MKSSRIQYPLNHWYYFNDQAKSTAIAIIGCNNLPQYKYFPKVLTQIRGYFAEQGVNVELDRVGGTIMTDFWARKYDRLVHTLGNAITTHDTQRIPTG